MQGSRHQPLSLQSAPIMEFKDYYQVLGVDRTASAEVIQKAFRRLARKHHPDINPAADSAARMQELNEAYEVLRDSERRAAYDHVGQGAQGGQPFQPPPGWNSGYEFSGAPGDWSDDGDHSAFFEALFGEAQRRASRSRAGGEAHPPHRRRGQDHHARIVVPLTDAFHGATRSITLHRPAVAAGGHGVLRERTLQVSIPKGIRAGQQIRLAGQGSAGLGDGPAGDLYLEVAFEPHALWRVDGHDLYLTLPLAPWEAALGAEVEVPTPDGTVAMHVPAGSQAGRKLRLRGRGIPGREPGDLYVLLEVLLPPAPNDAARDAYRAMARDLPFDPRPHFGAAT
jgi:curved DNA-binding protein